MFEKTFEFDYSREWSQLIEDKAISPELQDWMMIYEPELLGVARKNPSTSRRVIIGCLAKRNVDMKEICEIIMNCEVPNEYK